MLRFVLLARQRRYLPQRLLRLVHTFAGKLYCRQAHQGDSGLRVQRKRLAKLRLRTVPLPGQHIQFAQGHRRVRRFRCARLRLLQYFFRSVQIVLAQLQSRQLDRGAQARREPLQCFFQPLPGVIHLAQTPFRHCQGVRRFDVVRRRRQDGLQTPNRIAQNVLVLAGRHQFRQLQLRTRVLRIDLRCVAKRGYPVPHIAARQIRQAELIISLGILWHLLDGVAKFQCGPPIVLLSQQGRPPLQVFRFLGLRRPVAPSCQNSRTQRSNGAHTNT